MNTVNKPCHYISVYICRWFWLLFLSNSLQIRVRCAQWSRQSRQIAGGIRTWHSGQLQHQQRGWRNFPHFSSTLMSECTQSICKHSSICGCFGELCMDPSEMANGQFVVGFTSLPLVPVHCHTVHCLLFLVGRVTGRQTKLMWQFSSLLICVRICAWVYMCEWKRKLRSCLSGHINAEIHVYTCTCFLPSF